MDLTIEGIHVKTYGDTKDQAIIFIHGFPFDHTLWKDVISGLSDDYYCISYDIRGFGNSSVDTGQYTMESYTQDLEHIISKLKLIEPIVCGFSMGGYIALRANEKPETEFKALILANTTTSSDNDEAKLKRASAISAIDSDGIEEFLDNFFEVAFRDEFRDTKEFKKLRSKVLESDPIGIKGALLAMVSRTDTTKSLNNIDIPVLVITAENDKVIPADVMKDMADKIKKSTFVSLKNSGHVSMLENPKEFKNAIKNFLD